MKSFPRMLAILLPIFLAATAEAQIEIDAAPLHSRLVQYEPVMVKVRIKNNLSRDIKVASAGGEARLSFVIENAPGHTVAAMASGRRDSFTVPARGEEMITVDLLGRYDLRGTGPYTVKARLDLKDKSFQSSRMYLDVVPGLRIDELVTEVAETGGYRTFGLRSLNRERQQHLFLRVEDKEQRVCHGLYDLGRLIRIKDPKMSVDAAGNVLIVHQSGPDRTTRTTVSAAGKLIDRALYDASGRAVQDGSFRDRNELQGAHPATKTGASGFEPRDLIPLR